jgi:hypothetical protein
MQCPNYIFIRIETIQTLCTIDVQSLIFGNSLKNENENRLVFETVSKYIARTKRFELVSRDHVCRFENGSQMAE